MNTKMVAKCRTCETKFDAQSDVTSIADMERVQASLEAVGYELWRAVWWDKDNAGCLICREVVSVKAGAIWAKMHECGVKR